MGSFFSIQHFFVIHSMLRVVAQKDMIVIVEAFQLTVTTLHLNLGFVLERKSDS